MDKIIVSQLDNIWLNIDANSEGILWDLQEKFSFFVPNYFFQPKFKEKIWDGKIRLFTPYQKKLYVGLLNELKTYCKNNLIEMEINLFPKVEITKESFSEFITSLNLHADGQKITPYDYQYLGAFLGLRDHRKTLLSSTASGKSLIIYMMLRYLQPRISKKILIVVPRTSLVEQMYKDFDDYASEVEWSSEDNVHRIYQGQDKKTKKQVVVTTWQSVYKSQRRYFDQFDAIFVDECHEAKANSLKGILEKSDATYKIGLTGTLDDAQAHEWVIQGLLGPKVVISTYEELMDRKQIAQLNVNVLNLNYNQIDRKTVRTEHKSYQKEVDFIVSHKKRNNFICNLANKLEDNTLVLFLKIDHGKELKKILDEKVKGTGKQVHLVYGEIDTKERERIRELTEENDNVIIVASYGTFSTGINIKRLHNIVFASPTKSKIRVLQSIGRILRLHKLKLNAELYDIVDDFSHGAYENYALKHFVKRFSYYAKEKFPYKTINIDI